MIEKFELDEALAEVKKKTKRAEESWKHNFLFRYLENTQKVIETKSKEDFYL